MNALLNIRLRKLALIIAAWMIIGVLLSIYDHMLLISHYSDGYSQQYAFLPALAFNLGSSFMGGLLGGWFLIFVIDKHLRSEPYYKSIIAVCIAFVMIISIITLITSTIQALAENNFDFNDPQTKTRMLELILTTVHIKNIMFWASIVGLTQITLQVNDKFGKGLLWSMIYGKYQLPQTEERIFMFLDLKSSTTIAERLGNLKYHGLLKDVFSDITDPILNTRGEIYQYVGDEVVISWSIENGIDQGNCLACFFGIKEVLETFKDKYVSNYDVLPEFKAGVHYGKVIAGEIGVIKRDITYSGDVLNTTARIQGMCNELNQLLIVSEALINKIDQPDIFKYSQLGNIKLKGREEQVNLYGVNK